MGATSSSQEADGVQSGPNEQTVQMYFEALGWTVTKLPAAGNGKAADFRVCQDSHCFLCEVKTVDSARASFSFTPTQHYLEQRQKRRAMIDRWKAENPDGQLVLRRDEYDFVYGDEAEFRKKYRDRRRNTQYWFREFAQCMEEYFTTSSPVRHLPYMLRLDSQDLYRPTPDERDRFFEWLDEEIQAIHRGSPSWRWSVDRWSDSATFYGTFYGIHHPSHATDTKVEYQVSLLGPMKAGALEVHVHSYGTLNLDRIAESVREGVKQLDSSASRESDQQIARVIVLGLKTGVGPLEWGQLSRCITGLLADHVSLSAIAVLRWTPDGIPPNDDNPLATMEFYATTPAVPSFAVYHNPWLEGVRYLAVTTFSDRWSSHICPINEAAFSSSVV